MELTFYFSEGCSLLDPILLLLRYVKCARSVDWGGAHAFLCGAFREELMPLSEI